MGRGNVLLKLIYVRMKATRTVIAIANLGRPFESTFAMRLCINPACAKARRTRDAVYIPSAATEPMLIIIATLMISGTPLMPASFIAITNGLAAADDPPRSLGSLPETRKLIRMVPVMYTNVTRAGTSLVA